MFYFFTVELSKSLTFFFSIGSLRKLVYSIFQCSSFTFCFQLELRATSQQMRHWRTLEEKKNTTFSVCNHIKARQVWNPGPDGSIVIHNRGAADLHPITPHSAAAYSPAHCDAPHLLNILSLLRLQQLSLLLILHHMHITYCMYCEKYWSPRCLFFLDFQLKCKHCLCLIFI